MENATNSISNSNSDSNSNSKLHPNEKKRVHAILVVLPQQGHVIPFVQLAIKLASKGFSITFINTEHIHHKISLSNAAVVGKDGGDIFAEARKRYSGLDIEYMTITDGLPLEFDRSLNHDQWVGATTHCFPAHLEVAINRILRSRPSVGCCLIADSYFVWAAKLASKFGLVHVSFWTENAMVLDIYFHRHLLKQNGHIGPALDDTKQAHFILGNTVQELEAHTIEAVEAHVPFYAIGPLFPPGFTKMPVATSLWAESDCTVWLDSKPPSSVLYVSFGSYAHINKEELEEIANGIKLSGVNFLWVIRPDMVSSDDPDPLPAGFRDEVRDRGMIVTWTCQKAKVYGVKFRYCVFPLLTDQFTNRKLIVDDWKIGCNLCDVKPVKKEEVFPKIKDLISGSMGCELHIKIKSIKQVLQNATMMQGSSERNVDDFIQELSIAIQKK
ncbi:UDP-glycosyltransferase 86A1 [Bienertia sinuspersici]